MKPITPALSLLTLLWLLLGCAPEADAPLPSEEQDPAAYLTFEQQLSIRFQMGAYLDKKPDGAADSVRLDSAYADIYRARAQRIALRRYVIDTQDVHFFMVLKPEFKSIQNKYRAIGGYYRLDAQGRIYGLDLLFFTPAEPLPVVDAKGDLLFQTLRERGDLGAYGRDPDYVEFPNAQVYYNQQTNNWEMRP